MEKPTNIVYLDTFKRQELTAIAIKQTEDMQYENALVRMLKLDMKNLQQTLARLDQHQRRQP